MLITWEVDDGYVGKSRPHHTEVSDEDLAECETEEEREELITESIQADFDSEISWGETNRE